MSLQITRGGSSEGSNPGGSIELAKATAIMERYTTWNANEAIIPMMQEIQHEYGYIPDVLTALISETFDVPLTQIYGAATFYSDFRALPQPEHRVLLCEGLACYVCGSQELHRTVKEKLGIEYGEATPDNKFILERANYCFGACQLMPMVEIDHTFYGNVTPEKLVELIDRTAQSEGHSSHDPE